MKWNWYKSNVCTLNWFKNFYHSLRCFLRNSDEWSVLTKTAQYSLTSYSYNTESRVDFISVIHYWFISYIQLSSFGIAFINLSLKCVIPCSNYLWKLCVYFPNHINTSFTIIIVNLELQILMSLKIKLQLKSCLEIRIISIWLYLSSTKFLPLFFGCQSSINRYLWIWLWGKV